MPRNIYYWWNFGSLLGFCLISQITTGLFLRMFYENDTLTSFSSISQIERNINSGWIIRSLHANGASLFFIFIYLHIGRGLYFKSFTIKKVWLSGSIMLILLFATAFLGYVLPWGQISFWGATVITNLLSSIPYFGSNLTIWLWGGFSVRKSTLIRFFRIHFILPFIIVALSLIHIIFLHEKSSRNPLGSNSSIDKIPFNPFFNFKDILGVLITLIIFINLILIFPSALMDPDNFSPANPIVTPPHIQPEWYFLFAYAILRIIPNKLGGVIRLFIAIIILILLPFFSKLEKKHLFNKKIIHKITFIWWLINFICLTILGAQPIEQPFIDLAGLSSTLYFLFYLTII